MRTRDTHKKALAVLAGAALTLTAGFGFAQAQTTGSDGTYGMSRTNAGTGIQSQSAGLIAQSSVTGTVDTSGSSSSSGSTNSSSNSSPATTYNTTGTPQTSNATGSTSNTANMNGQTTFSGAADNMLLSFSDLKLGSTGQEVSTLQGFLAELGFLDLSGIGGPTGYYGEMTRDAVARYQAAIGVPSTGYFGPMTRQSMTMHFARNNWLNEGSGVAAGNSTMGTGGGTDLTGSFSYTNPGITFNGVWYPNAVDMSVTAPALSNGTSSSSGSTNGSSSSGTSTTTNNGNSGTTDTTNSTSGGTTNSNANNSSGSSDDTMGP